MNKMIFTVGLLFMSLVVTLVFADGLFNDKDAPVSEKVSGSAEIGPPPPISGMFGAPPTEVPSDTPAQ